MRFTVQKKELINLKNTLNALNVNKKNQWILDFSIVKLVSIWEQIIRNFCDENLLEIQRHNAIKVNFDKKRFYEFVWKSWLNGKQPQLNEEIGLQVKDVQRYSLIRNKVAHGNDLTEVEKTLISNINDGGCLLNKTLAILKEL